MDHVDLPSLAADATAEDAIKAMKDNSCSAVVVARISGPAVLGIDIITYTLRLKGNVKIKNVKPRDVTINLSEDSFAEDFLGQLETGMPDPKNERKSKIVWTQNALYTHLFASLTAEPRF